MVRVGVHVSIAGGIARSVPRAKDAGCDTFQIFSRNPRGWKAKDLDDQDVGEFREWLKQSGISPAVDHMPYLPNLAGSDPDLYGKSVDTLTMELNRCAVLGIPYLVTHLGHHQGEGIGPGRTRVIDAINTALGQADKGAMLLLENTAGEKNGVGNTFEDIGAVLDGVVDQERVGVCFDTCHAFGGGYELRTARGLQETLDNFDRAIGLSRVRVVHCNDSKGDLGSGLDRHEHIGLGYIGEEGFRTILHHPFFRNLPLICETPEDDRRNDAGNLTKVRELAGD
ncbi:deoxyribonuclease-4 [Methanolinea mesophila]|uniref:deoxyribonuclease IV n=1 Tax=Methanolinea mesophila TaxID=547055 RepID=UPI001AE9F714|nr:deoxyribonuclease IV [Methanolinea mesophila]MBP1928459.1 deoxyribonuclease-4 [Methanolinea mesophila]